MDDHVAGIGGAPRGPAPGHSIENFTEVRLTVLTHGAATIPL